ncbi:MAG: beta-xylosidase [Actinophytocola sp.]|nr:beta-xylosidase [Actinophytocola sp.]
MRVSGLTLVLVVMLVASGCTTVRGTSTGPDKPSSSRTQEPDAESPAEPAVRLDVAHQRGGPRVIAASRDPATDHGATLLRDGDRTRLWWCGRNRTGKRAGRAGTVILHASARDLDSRFTGSGGTKRGDKPGQKSGDKPRDKRGQNRSQQRDNAPRVVFSGGKGGFDAAYTCDPSVIKVGDVYYMYYTGTTGKPGASNAIGLATSKNGVRWRRANGGKAIVRPERPKRDGYGAGRPAVVYLDGWFYLLFTDSTASTAGSASKGGNRGQFLLRSGDAAFGKQVQALGERGFRPVSGTGAARTWSLTEGALDAPAGAAAADTADADLMWVDLLDAFAVAHATDTGTRLTFWDRSFSGHPYPSVTVRGDGTDGPGLVRAPTGHAPQSERDPCDAVPLDLVRATQGKPKRTGLRHIGADLVGAQGCADRADALRLLDGYAFPSPEHTMDLVVNGELVRVERRSVATILAPGGVLTRRPALPDLDVTARLNSGAPVLRSRHGQTGLLLDDGRLWPLRTPALAQRIARRNASDVRTVGDIAWGTYPVASVLG